MFNLAGLTSAKVGATALAIGFLAGSVATGRVLSWKHDAERLGEERAEAKAYRQASEDLSATSKDLKEALAVLEKNKFVVLRETRNEVSKIEYRTAVPANGVRLFNSSGKDDPATDSGDGHGGTLQGANGPTDPP